MPQPIPSMRTVGKLLTPEGQHHFAYLAIHPHQDLALLDAYAHDVGTAPSIRVVADEDTFLLLDESAYAACLAAGTAAPLDESTCEWVRERAEADEAEWYGCVTEVAIKQDKLDTPVVLGYYSRDEAEAIASMLTPDPHLVALNPKQILEADASGDVYHYQLRFPGDSEDSVLFVRAPDCDTGLEFSKAHLRSLRNATPEVEIVGINTGLLARAV